MQFISRLTIISSCTSGALQRLPGQTLSGQDVQDFIAKLGSSGGKRGYEGITGMSACAPEVTVIKNTNWVENVHGMYEFNLNRKKIKEKEKKERKTEKGRKKRKKQRKKTKNERKKRIHEEEQFNCEMNLLMNILIFFFSGQGADDDYFSWYINGLLIPEITLKRGETYTFYVEGGDDPTRPLEYHPLYITDDPVGGYGSKTDAQRQVRKNVIPKNLN